VVSAQRGFTYLTALFILAILMGGLALLGEVWENSAKREREAELLFIGNQYRRAIGLYYESTPGAAKKYPRELQDLIKDSRQPATQRYLRRLYPDPMTGKAEWGLVKAADGGIGGVYSLSEEAPLKVAGFRVRDADLEGKSKYSDWRFNYKPAAPAAGAAKPAAGQPSGQPAAGQPGLPGPAPAQPVAREEN
jgi:type II secretory pathway pseudopilin PulG